MAYILEKSIAGILQCQHSGGGCRWILGSRPALSIIEFLVNLIFCPLLFLSIKKEGTSYMNFRELKV
jgi:hypothetical protein